MGKIAPMTAINYRLGLLRIWFVASAVWVLVVGGLAVSTPMGLPADPCWIEPAPGFRIDAATYGVCIVEHEAEYAAYHDAVSRTLFSAVLVRLALVFGTPLVMLVMSFAGMRGIAWLRTRFRAT
jgi:hypothetical protein